MTRYVQRRITRRDAVRFWSHVDTSGYGCWPWTGARSKAGYGQLKIDGSTVSSARTAVRLAGIPIPRGMEVDHLCRNKVCVRLDHLEVVTKLENIRRRPTANELKTHCKAGHPFDLENTRIGNGRRDCKTCERESALAYYHRHKVLVDAGAK